MQQEDIYYKKYMKYKQKYLLLQEQMGGMSMFGLDIGSLFLKALNAYATLFKIDGIKDNAIYKEVEKLTEEFKTGKMVVSIEKKFKQFLINQLKNVDFFKENIEELKTSVDNIKFNLKSIISTVTGFIKIIKRIAKDKIIKIIDTYNLPENNKTILKKMINNIVNDKKINYNDILPKLKVSLKEFTKGKIEETLKNAGNNDNYKIPDIILQPMRMQLLPLKASLVLLDSPFGIFTPLYSLKKALPGVMISSANELLSMLISGNITKSKINSLVNTIFS